MGSASTLDPMQGPMERRMDFDRDPFLVIWEVTQACDLVCEHCRAEAQPERHAGELSTEEGKELLDQIADFQDPLFVITGGDPWKRDDIFELIEYADDIGLRVAMTPSGTSLGTRENIERAVDAGLTRLALSLEGGSPERHDEFRKQEGSFEYTRKAAEYAADAGLTLQINTTVTKRTVDDLPGIADIAEDWGAVLWSVFFLVPVGRGEEKHLVSPETAEDVLNWLYEQQGVRDFQIKTTEAPHYRRVVLQRMQEQGKMPKISGVGHNETDPGDGIGRASQGVNAGKGYVFISHLGDVYPSGFLPANGGNVRETTLPDIYRHSDLFQKIRDPDRLKGKCGNCEYRVVCGGSRSRAYALTGDLMAEDPSCAYIPKKMKKEEA